MAKQPVFDVPGDLLLDLLESARSARRNLPVGIPLDETLVEATARLNAEWTADVTAYDSVVAHILVMADVLSDGIAGASGAQRCTVDRVSLDEKNLAELA